ncbi:CBF/Mak21 family-domain-containing protein [Scleroderma yunnanense]
MTRQKVSSQKTQPKNAPKVSQSKTSQSKNIPKAIQLDASPMWYQGAPPLEPTTATTVTSEKLSLLLERATSLHTNAVQSFQSTTTVTSSSSDYNFLQNILQTGTLSDRLSALTLLVQSSPLHNIKALEALKNMAERGKGKGGREESLKALRCIVDWWVGGGAPNRKLKYFRDQPLAHPNADDRHLVVWCFEDWLKKFFFSVLQLLEVLSADPLSYVRMQTLSLIFTLLKEKPEQEQNLLRLLVNKLGDSENSICSRTSYHILQLLQVHPSMKIVVTREITSLILRPTTSTPTTAAQNTHIRFNEDGSGPKSKGQAKPQPDLATKKHVNEHARYYATITLNQIMFLPNERDVALQVMDVYFRLFEDILGERRLADEHDDAPSKASQPSAKSKPKRKGKEVIGEGGFTEIEDANSKLVSAILTGVNRALPFAKLGAADASLNKHIDTLFFISHKSTFNNSLQALVLIQQISATLTNQPNTSTSTSQSKNISDRYYRSLYASLHDGRLTSSSKQAMYLNLLFRSLKADNNMERVKSFIRRFVQVLVSGGAGGNEFVVGGLYLLGEIFSTVPSLRDLLQGTSNPSDGEDYDPRKRDPQYSRPSSSPLFELLPLLYHYHPTISLHARQLFTCQPITSSADLNLNTLSHFLDRFVYKNPKKSKLKGASAMQPGASAADGISVKKTKGEIGGGVLPNEEKFRRKREEDVRVDEVFFHRYFSQMHNKSRAKKEKEEESDGGGEEDESEEGHSEVESVPASDVASNQDEDEEEQGSDLDEDAVWKAMQATMPDMSGDAELLSDPDEEDNLDLEGDDDEDSSASEEDDTGSHGDALSFAEGSDDDDLLAIDDIPGFIEYDGSDASADEGDPEDGNRDEEWGGISEGTDKRKRKEKDGDEKRKKRRTLPTFASYEEYAKMIEDGPEDDI